MPNEGQPAGTGGSQTPPDDEQHQAEVTALKSRLGEYERMLMAPEYLEYLAEKSRGGTPRRGEEPVRQLSQPREEPVRPTVKAADVDQMSPSQLAEFILGEVNKQVGTVIDARVRPVEQKTILDSAKAEVAAARSAHPDFDQLRPAIMEEIKATPGLSVEKAYLIAKGSARPTPRTRSGSPPAGGQGVREKPPEGFEAAFSQAWREAGLPEPGG